MTLELVEKRCPGCGEVKSLTEFHRNKANKDGHQTHCKPCNLTRIKSWQERKRAEMGDEAWLTYRRAGTAKSRARNGMKRERQYNRARTTAVQGLIDAHRDEYEARLKLALDALERES